MKVYEGQVNLIGHGSWQDGLTKLSVLEIGDKSIRNIYLPDYLRNYINPGNNVRILVSNGIGKYSVFAVESNGKKYTFGMGKMILVFILSIIFTIGAFVFAWRVAMFIGLFVFAYQLKNIIDFIRF